MLGIKPLSPPSSVESRVEIKKAESLAVSCLDDQWECKMTSLEHKQWSYRNIKNSIFWEGPISCCNLSVQLKDHLVEQEAEKDTSPVVEVFSGCACWRRYFQDGQKLSLFFHDKVLYSISSGAAINKAKDKHFKACMTSPDLSAMLLNPSNKWLIKN